MLVCEASLVLLLRNGCRLDENLLEASFLILKSDNDFAYPLRYDCLLACLEVDTIVPNRIDKKSMEKCNFSYILHWNPNFQRRLVLEIDFVRFRLQNLLPECFAARTYLPR